MSVRGRSFRDVCRVVRVHAVEVARRVRIRRHAPSSFRGRLIMVIAVVAVVMLGLMAVVQNVVVDRLAREQRNRIVLCTSRADGSIVGVYLNPDAADFDMHQGNVSSTYYDDDGMVVCGSALTIAGDDILFDKELVDSSMGAEQSAATASTVRQVYTIGKTANDLTDSFVTSMRMASIGMLLVFGLMAVAVAWFAGSRASRRVSQVSGQVEALRPDDPDARISVAGPVDDEIGRLVSSINEMLDRAQAASQAERRFVSNASHELRTPIATVETNLDAPLAQGRFAKDVEPAVRRALAANRRGAALVQALLTLSRIQSGAMTNHSENEQVELLSLVDDAADQIDDRAVELGLDLHVHGTTLTVSADRNLLELAVDNLLRNAVDHHADPKGPSDVAVNNTTRTGGGDDSSDIRADLIDIGVRLTGDAAMISVTNPTDDPLPDNMECLKEPFHRGSGSRLNNATGVGLGLSIVDAAAHAMGGNLHLSSPSEGMFCAQLSIPLVGRLPQPRPA